MFKGTTKGQTPLLMGIRVMATKALHRPEVPASPIKTLDPVLEDPQVFARQMIVQIDGQQSRKK
jgi:crotonobetainyl-CoA:carnitine CoA-transferase CaiB-like acyl-CoA transferase